MRLIALFMTMFFTLQIGAAMSATIKVMDPGDNLGLIGLNKEGKAVDFKNPRSYPTIFDFSAKYPYYLKSCYSGTFEDMETLVKALTENARNHPAVIRVRLAAIDLLRNGDLIVELESKAVDLKFENEIVIKTCK